MWLNVIRHTVSARPHTKHRVNGEQDSEWASLFLLHMCNAWVWREEDGSLRNLSEMLRKKKSQNEHDALHLWSALSSFILIVYSVTKGKLFCFHWTTPVDLQIILSTTYLHLKILAIIGLSFIISWFHVVFMERQIWYKILDSLSDRKSRWPLWWFHRALADRKGPGVWRLRTPGQTFHIWGAKTKFISRQVKKSCWPWLHTHKGTAIHMLVFSPKEVWPIIMNTIEKEKE